MGQGGENRGDGVGRAEKQRGAKYLGRAGKDFGSTRGGGGMARGEKSGLERELSLAEGRRAEQGTGILFG